MNKRQWLLAISSAAILVLSGCASMGNSASAGNSTSPASSSTVADVTAKAPGLYTLNHLIKTAGLSETLSGAGPYTLFAPSDEAFMQVPAETMAQLAAHPEQLKALLMHHVVAGKLAAADIGGNAKLKALDGSDLAASHAGTFLTVDEALVTTPDLTGSNGVVHVIDTVLIPPKKK
jgi:uncharacterized surface protein with fasciclin (FAS1) repeats